MVTQDPTPSVQQDEPGQSREPRQLTESDINMDENYIILRNLVQAGLMDVYVKRYLGDDISEEEKNKKIIEWAGIYAGDIRPVITDILLNDAEVHELVRADKLEEAVELIIEKKINKEDFLKEVKE